MSLCSPAVNEYLQRRTITPCHLYRPVFSTYNSFYCRHFQDIFVDTIPGIFKVIFANVNVVVCSCLLLLLLLLVLLFFFSLFTFSTSCYNYVVFRLLEISVIHPAKCKLPSITEICICILVYAYENEVLKKKN